MPRTKEKTRKVVLPGYVPQDDAIYIKRRAAQTDRPASYIVALAIREWIKRDRRRAA